MASTTPNIGLTLPTGGERVSRQIINDNNTIIDGKMGAVPGGQNLQGEIDALNDNVEEKIPSPLSLKRINSSTTSYQFTCPRRETSSYSYFLLIGGTGLTAPFVWHGFVNTASNNNTVGLQKVFGSATVTLTGSYNGTTNVLTINASETCWGGIRMIWLS